MDWCSFNSRLQSLRSGKALITQKLCRNLGGIVNTRISLSSLVSNNQRFPLAISLLKWIFFLVLLDNIQLAALINLLFVSECNYWDPDLLKFLPASLNWNPMHRLTSSLRLSPFSWLPRLHLHLLSFYAALSPDSNMTASQGYSLFYPLQHCTSKSKQAHFMQCCNEFF